jgi:hypothetical protein
VADQASRPTGSQPQYETDDLERGQESQWSTRSQALNSKNAIPNDDKSSTTQMQVTTAESPVTTEEAEVIIETTVPTTEAAVSEISTTAENSTVCTTLIPVLGFG